MNETDINEILNNAKTALNAALANPKPSYRAGEHDVSWNEHIKVLKETIAWCQEELAKIPCEETTIWRYE